MKVKHYDMVVAKAANFELVQLMKINNVWEVVGSKCGETINFSSDYEYFLCLPENKDSCLYWLNGFEVQEKGRKAGESWWSDSDDSEDWSSEWHEDHIFMSNVSVFRIKPKKEKRWLMVQPISGQTTNHFSSPERAMDSVSNTDSRWQLMEIEVERNDR